MVFRFTTKEGNERNEKIKRGKWLQQGFLVRMEFHCHSSHVSDWCPFRLNPWPDDGPTTSSRPESLIRYSMIWSEKQNRRCHQKDRLESVIKRGQKWSLTRRSSFLAVFISSRCSFQSFFLFFVSLWCPLLCSVSDDVFLCWEFSWWLFCPWIPRSLTQSWLMTLLWLPAQQKGPSTQWCPVMMSTFCVAVTKSMFVSRVCSSWSVRSNSFWFSSGDFFNTERSSSWSLSHFR
jgi:hypothetical protein